MKLGLRVLALDADCSYSMAMRPQNLVAVSLIIIFVAISTASVLACTSFAVYGDRTLYGMNFDYPPNEIRFSIEQHEVGAVFIGSFWMGDQYGRTVGMNEHGLFSSDQMISPLRAPAATLDDGEMYIWNAYYEGLSTCTSVAEVLDMIGERRLVQYPSPALHNLFADPSGDAMVVETGAAENAITRIDGPFLVMTNFHNSDFCDSPLGAIVGGGADRYRTAHRMIEGSEVTFDIDQAFAVLESTSQPSGSYKTRWSLVADPEALGIYIALERDYDHIWKVSLHERTIETFRGFATQHTLPLDDVGVTGPALQAIAMESPALTEQGYGRAWLRWTLLAAGLLALGWLVIY